MTSSIPNSVKKGYIYEFFDAHKALSKRVLSRVSTLSLAFTRLYPISKESGGSSSSGESSALSDRIRGEKEPITLGGFDFCKDTESGALQCYTLKKLSAFFETSQKISNIVRFTLTLETLLDDSSSLIKKDYNLYVYPFDSSVCLKKFDSSIETLAKPPTLPQGLGLKFRSSFDGSSFDSGFNTSFKDASKSQKQMLIEWYVSMLKKEFKGHDASTLNAIAQEYVNLDHIQKHEGLCVGYSFSFILMMIQNWEYLTLKAQNYFKDDEFPKFLIDIFKKNTDGAALFQMAGLFSILHGTNIDFDQRKIMLTQDPKDLLFPDLLRYALYKIYPDLKIDGILSDRNMELFKERKELVSSLENALSGISAEERIFKQTALQAIETEASKIREEFAPDETGLYRKILSLKDENTPIGLEIQYLLPGQETAHSIAIFSDARFDMYLFFDSNKGLMQFDSIEDLASFTLFDVTACGFEKISINQFSIG